MEILFEIVAEIFLQGFGEVLFDCLVRSKNPAVRTFGASLLSGLAGLLLGGLSLLVYRTHLIGHHELRVGFFVLIPFLNGWILSRIGRSLEQRDRSRSSFEYFIPAFFFSVCFGLVRLVGAE